MEQKNNKKDWTVINVPMELYDELTILQEKLKGIYGFNLAYWEVVNYLLRFYKQHSKSDHDRLEKSGGKKD